ncbi:hypothetical protein ABT061_09590 [Streptosporangium sp. NPDC002544]|uniref:hypothetical protein n=1 Tax=Streptosporangium sp. NPDC002544 TaxID=3154538 RepID=UPI00332D4578
MAETWAADGFDGDGCFPPEGSPPSAASSGSSVPPSAASPASGAVPSLAFTVGLPPAWHDPYRTPVIGGGLVLVACGWQRGTTDEAGPVLAALDAGSGVERFRLRIPVARPGATDCQVGIPCPLPDGRILVPVYQWDVSLVVYLLAPDGGITRADDLGAGREAELHVFGSDLGIKLWQEPLVAGPDAYAASWVYRARAYRMQCRDLATGALRWEADERVLARVGDVVVTETAPEGDGGDRGAVVGRAIGDGGVLWRLQSRPLYPERSFSPGAVVGRSLVLVDRGRRMAADDAREEGILELVVDSSADQVDFDELERLWDREHPPPGEDLVGYGSADGGEEWRFEMRGTVTSVVAGPASVCAVVVDDAGRCSLERVHLDGAVPRHVPPIDLATVPDLVTALRTGDLGVGGMRFRAHETAPIVAHIDHDRLLLATDTELVCLSVADPRAVIWRMPLPESPRVTRPTTTDRRIATASISCGQGLVHVRGHADIWTFG